MKNRDAVLFALPLTAILVMGAFAIFLYCQISRFEDSYFDDVKSNIEQKAHLAADIVTPMLDSGKLYEAILFCNTYNKDALRLSLIDAKGRVAADSAEKTAFLSNHLDRTEVKSAFAGTPQSVIRYSESLNQWMIYHAVKLKTGKADYVLRAAVTTDRVSKAIDFTRLNMVLALLFGVLMVLPLFFYIFNKVRKPLVALQNSAEQIAGGNLDAHIDIPKDGVVRELALTISEMNEQLKTQLGKVTSERNQKHAILNTMSDAVLLFSTNDELVKYNQAAAELFGLPDANAKFNLARCGVVDLLPLAHAAFQSGESFEKEFEILRNGIMRTVFIKGNIIVEYGVRELLLSITDLTNLRKLESFRSDFIANVSHEIKTPLTCITGAVEALQDEEVLPKEQSDNLLAMLASQSKRLNLLVQDILSLAALEKKQLNPTKDFTLTSLDAMLENAVNLCMEHAKNSNICLNITENTAIKFDGDCQLLEQAVVNIIDNAINYSISPKIDVSLTQKENTTIIEVKDYGIGIPAEHQSRIFERFYRVHKERARELGGTGLGLAIVKHIAALHGGYAELESNSGHGCTFRIILPL